LLAVVPLTLVGVGIAWRMSKAVLRGFVEMGGTLERTPKFGRDGPRRSCSDATYDQPLASTLPEILFAAACVLVAGLAVVRGNPRMAPSLLFFGLSFATVGLTLLGD